MNNLIHKVKKKCFFEGWYFKCQKGDQIISFIPSYNTDADGKSHVFIQIIMNDNSYAIPFTPEDFSFNRNKLFIRIGDNFFSKKGIKININTEEIVVKGILYFGKMIPLRYTIMGYFHYFPKMECKHEIISMYHKVKGSLVCNGRKCSVSPGVGYLEKDMGYSFPGAYIWLQCNHFLKEKCSVFLSIAEIPYHGIHFNGCICAVLYKGKEYRFATYLGVKIIKYTHDEICLKQGKYFLAVKLYNKEAGNMESSKNEAYKKSAAFSHRLFAPVMGEMSRIIKEQHLTFGRFLLYEKGKLLFKLGSRKVSYEYVE